MYSYVRRAGAAMLAQEAAAFLTSFMITKLLQVPLLHARVWRPPGHLVRVELGPVIDPGLRAT